MSSEKIGELVCPPGYHIVRGHYRSCHSGTVTWIHQHVARNPGRTKEIPHPKLDSYSAQDLRDMFDKSGKRYPPIGKICGFPPNDKLDAMIQFWLDYWKRRGLKYPPDLTARHVKGMIAKESSFNPRAVGSKLPTAARGLMQILPDTRDHLNGLTKELKNEHLHVSQDDLFDPVISIACGTRWLTRKYELIPKGAAKNAFNAVKAYNQWNAKGDLYAKEIFDMVNKKCP